VDAPAPPTDGDPDDAADDLDALRDRIGDPRRWSFVLDFDGTLAPIVDHPGDATPAPGALEAVAALAGICEVALLSGRALHDLEARLGEVPPGVLLVGGHGSEGRRPDGTHVALADLEAARDVLDELEATLRDLVDEDAGWEVERKSTSLVVHHRRVAPDTLTDRLPDVRAALEDATDRGPGFVVADGKAILELKLRGIDKGVALAWLHEQAAGRAVHLADEPTIAPIVFGDDTTDEDAFAAALRLGGEAVLVADAPATTSARFRLRDPARVVTLLRAVRDPLGDEATAAIPHDAWGR
jgi:trehalose 6-phosphate phosphatase